MTTKRKVTPVFRPFPCNIRYQRNWLHLSADAANLLRALLTDDYLASAIPGVCPQVPIGIAASVMRTQSYDIVKAALEELEAAEFLLIDWDTMLIYCPAALRESPHPRTIRALKGWEPALIKMPAGELREQIEADIAALLTEQKTKVGAAFAAMCGKIAEAEIRAPKKRGPKVGSRRGKKLEETSHLENFESNFEQKNSKEISNRSEVARVSPAEFGETPKNSELPKVSPDAGDALSANLNHYNELGDLILSRKKDREESKKRDEKREGDWRLETGETKPETNPQKKRGEETRVRAENSSPSVSKQNPVVTRNPWASGAISAAQREEIEKIWTTYRESMTGIVRDEELELDSGTAHALASRLESWTTEDLQAVARSNAQLSRMHPDDAKKRQFCQPGRCFSPGSIEFILAQPAAKTPTPGAEKPRWQMTQSERHAAMVAESNSFAKPGDYTADLQARVIHL